MTASDRRTANRRPTQRRQRFPLNSVANAVIVFAFPAFGFAVALLLMLLALLRSLL